jgi:hypothetical protein
VAPEDTDLELSRGEKAESELTHSSHFARARTDSY